MSMPNDSTTRNYIIDPVYKELSDKISGSDPEYTPRLLQKMYTLEVAKLVNALPAPVEELASKFNLTPEEVEQTLEGLVKKGYVLKTKRGYRSLSSGLQFGDLVLCVPTEFDDEFLMLAHKTMFNENVTKIMRAQQGETKRYRVIPRWKAIKDIPGIMPCEDMREIFENNADKLTNTRCCCRVASSIANGEAHSRKCGLTDGTVPSEGHCNHIGYISEYYTEVMGITKYLTPEQMLESLEPLEKSRSFTRANNARDVNFLCNCCDCCSLSYYFRTNSSDAEVEENIEPSRFMCMIDETKCNGCGVCVTKCPFDAIVMEDGKAKIKKTRCYGCGSCVLNCSEKALKLKLVRPAEHIPTEASGLPISQIVFGEEPSEKKG